MVDGSLDGQRFYSDDGLALYVTEQRAPSRYTQRPSGLYPGSGEALYDMVTA